MDEIKVTKTEGNWLSGTYGAYRFQVKRYDQPSKFGIDFCDTEGHVSKLWVCKGYTCVANYDRGWDILPSSEDDQDAVAEIIFAFN